LTVVRGRIGARDPGQEFVHVAERPGKMQLAECHLSSNITRSDIGYPSGGFTQFGHDKFDVVYIMPVCQKIHGRLNG